MNENMNDYILITATKNEAENLPAVISSIILQTKIPKLWLIVDDGSTDNSRMILTNIQHKYEWIKVFHLPEHPRDITFHYSFVCNAGFQLAIDYCAEKSYTFEFIGLLDADTEVVPDYFENLIKFFQKDASLGIISGGIYHKIDGSLKWNGSNENLPAGTGRMWRKECFLNTGGYAIEPAPDSISNVKAILDGWKVKKFKEIVAIERRLTGSSQGFWSRGVINGKIAHYLNKHPILIILMFLNLLKIKPYYTGFAYLYGYLIAFVAREEKIADKEVKDYYWNSRVYDYLPNIKFLSRSR